MFPVVYGRSDLCRGLTRFAVCHHHLCMQRTRALKSTKVCRLISCRRGVWFISQKYLQGEWGILFERLTQYQMKLNSVNKLFPYFCPPMGRIFEVRKSTMFARYDRMAKQFTRIGKEIAIAVKAAGPEPDYNPSLRRAILNARGVNMPKDKIEAAIKRAMGKDMADYEEVLYEGYAPHGVAVIIEAASDNI